MFMLFFFFFFGLEKKALLLVFVLLLARTARFETFNRVRERRMHSFSCSVLALRSWDPATATSSGLWAQRSLLRGSCPLTPPPPASLHSDVSLFSCPFQQLLWSALLLLAWLVSFLMQNPQWHICFVSFFFYFGHSTYLIILLRHEESLEQPADEPGSWCFILPLDLHFTLYDIT